MMKKLSLFCVFVLLIGISSVYADERNDTHSEQYTVDSVESLEKKYDAAWTRVERGNDKRLYGAGINLQKTKKGKRTNLASVSDEDIEKSVRGFITDNRDLFGVAVDNLELQRLESDKKAGSKKDSMRYVFYQQEYKGVPIFDATLGFVIDNTHLVMVDSNIHANIDISIDHSLSEEQARETVRTHLGKKRDVVEKAELVIYPIESETGHSYALAWKMDTFVLKDAKWLFMVDANTGEILLQKNNIAHATLQGHVTGDIYPEHSLQSKVSQPFAHQEIGLVEVSNHVLYSTQGNDLLTHAQISQSLDLTDAQQASLSFAARYTVEEDWDFARVQASIDGSTWETLVSYTGSLSEWATQSIDLGAYLGDTVHIRFEYFTDEIVVEEGFYVDNVSVMTDSGTLFSDNFENGSSSWTLDGFMIEEEFTFLVSDVTDESGVYSFDMPEGDYLLAFTTVGPYANVINENDGQTVFFSSVSVPSEFLINWTAVDGSYKGQDSNAFYHVNKIHDFFTKGAPFDIHEMDYEMKVTLEADEDECNAFSTGTDIYFYGAGPNCENTALSSDIIYHEYTHSVHYQVYGETFESPDGSIMEGLADYFAASVNNNSCVAEATFYDWECLRDVNNTLRYPDDLTGGDHHDSMIFSAALWDIRQSLGQEFTDDLVMLAMKTRPHDFHDYLDALLIVDDDNANLTDGTPNMDKICDAFHTKRGIKSFSCISSGDLYLKAPLFTYTNTTPVFVSNATYQTSQIVVPDFGTVKRAFVYVNMTHTWIGDLEMVLIAPNGQNITLHNQAGGSLDNIVTWYDNETLVADSSDLADFINMQANGTWKLRMRDHFAPADAGTLREFTLHLYLDQVPNVTIVGQTPNTTVLNETDSFTLDVTTEGNVEQVLLEFDGQKESVEGVVFKNNATSWYIKKKGILDGNHTFRVHAVTPFGTVSSTELQSIFANNTRDISGFFNTLEADLASENVTVTLLNNGVEVNASETLSFLDYTLQFNPNNGLIVETYGFDVDMINQTADVEIFTVLSSAENITQIFNETGGVLGQYMWIELNDLLPTGEYIGKIIFPTSYGLYYYMNGTPDNPSFHQVKTQCVGLDVLPCYETIGNTSILYLPSFSGGAAGNDTVIPTVNILSPTATMYTTTSVDLTYTTTDNGVIDSCWYSLNGGTNTTIDNCANIAITASAGSNTLTLFANDSSDNVGKAEVTFTVSLPSSGRGGGGGGGGGSSTRSNSSVPAANVSAAEVVEEDSSDEAEYDPATSPWDEDSIEQEIENNADRHSSSNAITGFIMTRVATPVGITWTVSILGVLAALYVRLFVLNKRKE